ncbi:MAG: lamin tail domain-containing protein, partial [Dehalococcoidia bacterium]
PKIIGSAIEIIDPGTSTIGFGTPNGTGGDDGTTEDAGEIVFNPISGTQDAEYISIINSGAAAVDISGWQITGGVGFTFQSGTVVPAGGTLYVSPDVVAFRARSTGPSGNQGLFVQGGYSGHLSNAGETLQLLNDQGTLVTSITLPTVLSDVQKFLRISELNYHPQDPTAQEIADLAPTAVSDNSFEYIEMVNTSTTETLDLTGVTFSDGIDFGFTGSAVTSLLPGARLLIVRDQAAFEARYGTGFSSIIAGEFANDTGLSNGSETVKIEDVDNSTVLEFKYDDDWYKETDSEGFSLVIQDEAGPVESWETSAGWRSSAATNGSPGELDPEARVGDFNGDRNTNRADLMTLLQYFGLATGSYRTRGDVNLDGATSLVDLAFVQANFGDTVAPAPSAQASSQVEAVDAVFTGLSRQTEQRVDFTSRTRRIVRSQRRSTTSEQEDPSHPSITARRTDRASSLRARRGQLRSDRDVQEEAQDQ